MNYSLTQDVITLLSNFESCNKTLPEKYPNDILGFKNWITDNHPLSINDIYWEAKEKGRSIESVIATTLFHLNKYAKFYSRSALYGSHFFGQEDINFLIVLHANGAMTKMELIKKNIQDKPTGIKIINRLIVLGYIKQIQSKKDKRCKQLAITVKGKKSLEKQMNNMRDATKIITGNLSENEKISLLKILLKLDHFHHNIYIQNLPTKTLLKKISI